MKKGYKISILALLLAVGSGFVKVFFEDLFGVPADSEMDRALGLMIVYSLYLTLHFGVLTHINEGLADERKRLDDNDENHSTLFKAMNWPPSKNTKN